MSNFIANNNTYNIITENEISVILAHFNKDYIFDIIKSNISDRFKYTQLNMPNIINSFERYYKQIKVTHDNLPSIVKEVDEARNETYREVISILTKEYNFTFNYDEFQDLCSIAYYLYDFLVCNFTNNIVTFFTNFIITERNGLYEALNLSNMKKSKDSSTIYNKKVYKNTKLAIINANLEYVLDNIVNFDITLSCLLNNIYQDKNIVKYLELAIIPIQDFFKNIIVPIYQNPRLKTAIITEITMKLHEECISDDIEIEKFIK